MSNALARRDALKICFGVVGSLLSRKALACVTCHDFNGNGYSGSQISCDEPENCGPAGGLRRSYLDSLHPGLFTRLGRNSLVVTEVILGSPSAKKGISPGDEITMINGTDPLKATSVEAGWANGYDSKVAHLAIRTGNVEKELQVNLVKVRELLDSGWTSIIPSKHPINLHRSAGRLRGGYDGVYGIGMKWIHQTDVIEVADVMMGSPAHVLGLQSGDKITSVCGVSVCQAEPSALALLLPSSFPAKGEVALKTVEGVPREIEIRSVGVSQLLHRIAQYQRVTNLSSGPRAA